MKCFTWSGGVISEGIALVDDERLGRVVFLGEAGRGRRYEKIALGRRNPAEAIGGRVREAHLVKITLPPKDGKPEKAFYVLERPRDSNSTDVLVRVCTLTSYIRNARGYYITVEGSPEIVIHGHGAFGDAGRIGTWRDGLVVMKPGDVLRVFPTRGQPDGYAVWLEEGIPVTATWQDYQNLRAVEKAEAIMAEADALTVVAESVRCHTFVAYQGVVDGLEVSVGKTGPAIMLGEEGRGSSLVEVPIIGYDPPQQIERATIVELAREETTRSREEPKVIFGLTESEEDEADSGSLLIRIQFVNRSGHVGMRPLRGSPLRVGGGKYSGGDAGRAGSGPDELWLLQPGDVVVMENYRNNIMAFQNEAGQLTSQRWELWEAADGQANPQKYIEQGKARWGFVPEEWIGCVVQLIQEVRELDNSSSRRREVVVHRATNEGELVSINPLILNLGWDGRDRREVRFDNGVWLVMTDKQVRHLDEAEKRDRAETQAKAGQLRDEAKSMEYHALFPHLERDLRSRIESVALGNNASKWHVDVAIATTDEISAWCAWAESVMDEARKAIVDFETRLAQQEAGEIWFDVVIPVSTESRTHTSVWCILPDGETQKAFDMPRGFKGRVDSVRFGDLPTDRLVLSHRHDNYGFTKTEVWEVHYLPNQLTDAQKAKVVELAGRARHYFASPFGIKYGPSWDLSRVGTVRYQTEYSRDFKGDKRAAYDAMCASMPIDPRDYVCEATREENGELVVTVTTKPRNR